MTSQTSPENTDIQTGFPETSAVLSDPPDNTPPGEVYIAGIENMEESIGELVEASSTTTYASSYMPSNRIIKLAALGAIYQMEWYITVSRRDATN